MRLPEERAVTGSRGIRGKVASQGIAATKHNATAEEYIYIYIYIWTLKRAQIRGKPFFRAVSAHTSTFSLFEHFFGKKHNSSRHQLPWDLDALERVSCAARAHTLRVAGGKKLLELCCSGNKCVFSGSLTNLHMLDAFWHFGVSVQLATSSAILKSVRGSVVPRPKARKDVQVLENEDALSTVHTY